MGIREASDLHQKGRLAEAEAECRRAIRSAPADADPHHLLALILQQGGRTREAIESLRRAAKLGPDVPQIRMNLGAMLGPLDPPEALGHLLHALRLRPGSPELHNNIALTLEKLGRLAEAEGSIRTALLLRGDYADAHCNLAGLLRMRGRLGDAADAYRTALRLRPGLRRAREGMAGLAGECLDAAEAAACYRALAEERPLLPGPRSAMLYTLHYLDDVDAETLAREHREWGRLFCEPVLKRAAPHANNRDPERRLRVGYVSPDLREHTPPRFISASFEHHDRDRFEFYCYSDVQRPDAMTERLKGLVEHWRETRALNDEELEKLIRSEQIDILVDLRGHAADNRLTLFSRKPAPVQVNMVGYFNTTGLSAMDWRLTDAVQDPFDGAQGQGPFDCAEAQRPPGGTDCLHTERLARIEPSCWCYTPPADAPAVAAAPAVSAGHVTFGSLNKLVKVSPACAALWSRVLAAVPASRLLLASPGGDADGSVRRRLAELGLPVERVDLAAKTATGREYLEQYKRLDTFPFGGITTTCDSLWMGVPVVSLAGGTGRTSVSRAGKSILSAAGLPHLCAASAEEFVAAAAGLAADVPALAQLRRSMRDRLSRSPLLDHRGFARKLDDLYRSMWRNWCDKPSACGACAPRPGTDTQARRIPS